MKKRHRIFIAINLPGDIKKYLSGFEKKWPELSRSQSDRGSSIESGPAKWVSQDNLHITLVFLGDLTDVELGEVCIIAKEVAERHNSFDINFNKVSYGPLDKIPPKMIWVSGEKNKELSLLKKYLEELLLEKVRFKPEERSFSPHITLARISTFLWRQINPEERPDVNENIELNFTVESIEVMESELKRGGPQYIIIESYSLK